MTMGFVKMAEPAYRAHPAINASLLRRVATESLYSVRHKPERETRAMVMGTALHAAVLEPDEYARRYPVPPDVPKRSNADKAIHAAWAAEHPDAIVLEPAERARVEGMRDAILADPQASFVAKSAAADRELTALWAMDWPGQPQCKARFDFVCRSLDMVVDVKTAADVSPRAFASSASALRYHMQAAWYSEGYRIITGTRRAVAFVHCVVQSCEPYEVAWYQVDPSDVRVGLQQCREAWDKYRAAKAADAWPGYAPKIQVVRIAPWALGIDGAVELEPDADGDPFASTGGNDDALPF